MNTTTKTAAVGGALLTACAACCAVSIAPAIALGTGLASIGGAAAAWGGTALLLAIPVVGIYYMSGRLKRKSGSAPTASSLLAGGCGCGPSSGGDEKVIACSLDVGDFKARTKSIRKLAERWLVRSHRSGLTLSLTYAAEALEEVRDLVAKERECCTFLDFELSDDRDGVHLRITAPKEAAAAADLLFAHFAPDAAGKQLEEIA